MGTREAAALLWAGQFAHAIERAEAVPERDGEAGVARLVVIIESLLFAERLEEARDRYAAHAGELEASKDSRADVVAIRAFFEFFGGDLDEARRDLLQVLDETPRDAPLACAVHFCLAAIAHRAGFEGDTARHLEHAMSGGQSIFVSRWADAQWAEIFPDRPRPGALPTRPSFVPASVTTFFRNLTIGARLLVFRTGGLARSFPSDQLAALVVFDLIVAAAIRFVGYRPGAHVLYDSIPSVSAPVFLFGIAPYLVVRKNGTDRLRVLVGMYAALPFLLAVALSVARDSIGRRTAAPAIAEVALAAWCTAIFVWIARKVGRAGVARIAVCALLYIGTFIVPMWRLGPHRLFFVPDEGRESYEAMERERAEKIFLHADRLHRTESELLGERAGVPDLYFVGAAGWAHQDVFGREIDAARGLFDERFDTRGRSIVLSNDPETEDEVPLASHVALRHVLRKVGSFMNSEEDILFLFLTSHGSQKGLGLSFGSHAPYDHETLRPMDVRSMLAEAHIKWRVVVVAGCESGTFTDLADDFTLVATAAARDRNSYGCASGNAYTEFGREVFDVQLRRETSFPTAFANAATALERSEVQRDLVTSKPQIVEGRLIGAKLRDFEARLRR